MKIPTANAAHIKIPRQMALIIVNEPASIIWANVPLGVGVGEGNGVAVTTVGTGVFVDGRTTWISGASNRVGDGVTDGVIDTVGVSVNTVGVRVGGAEVDVLPGTGVRVLVGVLDAVGVFVFCGLVVLLGVDVGSCVVVGVWVARVWNVTVIGPCISTFWLVSTASRM